MTNESQIFDFEKDFAGTLRCIPMIVRFKLDHCGIKLSLRQWSRFTHEDRAELLALPCSTPPDIRIFRDALVEMIALRAKEQAKEIALELAPAWTQAAEVPMHLIDYAKALGVEPPDQEQWAKLTPLQRFTLLKLTRDGHDNINFVPAMSEFGLINAELADQLCPRRRRK